MIERLFCANQEVSEEAIEAFLERQANLIKPQGTLGKVDEMAMRLASHQQTAEPCINKSWITIFAADHGIAQEDDLSEYPQDMTDQWVSDICKGKSAINVLAQFSNAELQIVDVGLITKQPNHDGLENKKIALGTANFAKQPAMSQEQLLNAILVGANAVEVAKEQGADLFIGGELGVANTTSAIAMIAVLSGQNPLELLGRGKKRVMRQDRERAAFIQNAITLHQAELTSPLRVLQYLGGFETAALCGAYIRAAQLGITIVVDGLMATTAAWIADLVSRNDQLLHCKSVEMMMDLGRFSIPETLFCICGNCPRLVEWCFFAHQSSENIHEWVLEILAVDAILHFDMHLGQATGAAMVIPLIQQACALNKEIAQLELIVPEEEPSGISLL